MKKIIFFTIALIGFLLPYSIATAINKEQQLLVAYLFNFGKFINWPNDKLEKNSTFNMCFYGDGNNQLPIKGLKNKTIQNHKIATSWIKRGDSIHHCHIVYIQESEAPYISLITNEIAGHSILTISKIKGHNLTGGIDIELFYENNKLRFNINLATSKQKKLQISSRLLTLAQKVLK